MKQWQPNMSISIRVSVSQSQENVINQGNRQSNKHSKYDPAPTKREPNQNIQNLNNPYKRQNKTKIVWAANLFSLSLSSSSYFLFI